MPKASFINSIREGGSRYLKESAHDKRTIKTTKREARELSKQLPPKEIAKKLGISPQKWTAINKDIKKGKIYGPEIRDKLRQIKEGKARTPRPIEIEKVKAVKEKKLIPYTILPEGIRYVKDHDALKKKMPWARVEKYFMTKQELRSYLETLPYEYFTATRQASKKQKGKYNYFLVDTRTPGELAKKGHLKREPKAEKIYRESFEQVGEESE